MIRKCRLDEQAARAMRALKPRDAMKIMHDIETSTADFGKASAFAYTAAMKLLGSPDIAEARMKYNLDDAAVSCLNALLPSEAREILNSIDAGVRNPSAFVTASARRFSSDHQGGQPHSTGGSPTSSVGSTQHGCSGAASQLANSLPPGLSKVQVEQVVEGIIRHMALDERACAVLHEVPLERAYDIVCELRKNWGNVKSPSAYVYEACLKELHNAGRVGGLTPETASPNAPVKFAPSTLPPTAPPLMKMPLQVRPPQPVIKLPAQPVIKLPQGLQPQADPSQLKNLQVRPPQMVPPRLPLTSTAAKVEAAITKYNLDDGAILALAQISPEAALDILNSIDSSVRNASAYVTTVAKKRAVPGPSGPASSGRSSSVGREDAQDLRVGLKKQVESLIRKLDLDRKASSALQEVPLESAMEILGELQRKKDQIRNPSAYVYNAAAKFHNPGQRQLPPSYNQAEEYPALSQVVTPSQQNEALAERLNLDAEAVSGMRSLPPEVAAEMLEQVRAQLHSPVGGAINPSEHFKSMVLHAFGMRAQHSAAEEAERLARELGISDDSLFCLQTIPLEAAVTILQRLKDTRSSVNDPSDFVMKSIQEYLAQVQGPAHWSPVGNIAT